MSIDGKRHRKMSLRIGGRGKSARTGHLCRFDFVEIDFSCSRKLNGYARPVAMNDISDRAGPIEDETVEIFMNADPQWHGH